MIALEVTRLTRRYTLEDATQQRPDRRQWLAEYRVIKGQIAELQANLKTEGQFNQQVELNKEIKRREAELRQMTVGN